MDKQETITIEDNHSFPAFTPNIGINQPNSTFTRCVYALFELLYVHTSVPFRGI